MTRPVSMMFSPAEISALSYQSARLELDRLRYAPGYSVPGTYVAAVALRAVEAATSESELATVVRTIRCRLDSWCPAGAVAQFWQRVAARGLLDPAR